MKKFLLSAMLLCSAFFLKAQTGDNRIVIAGELGIPLSSDFKDVFNTGFGGSVKGMYGVGTSGHVTLTSGYTRYSAKGSTDDAKGSLSIIPILLGYRHSFTGLYVEPQAGIGLYRGKVTYMGQSESSSSSAFTYAVGVGYATRQVDFGIRYQGATEDGDNIGLLGIHIGFNILSGKNK